MTAGSLLSLEEEGVDFCPAHGAKQVLSGAHRGAHAAELPLLSTTTTTTTITTAVAAAMSVSKRRPVGLIPITAHRGARSPSCCTRSLCLSPHPCLARLCSGFSGAELLPWSRTVTQRSAGTFDRDAFKDFITALIAELHLSPPSHTPPPPSPLSALEPDLRTARFINKDWRQLLNKNK